MFVPLRVIDSHLLYQGEFSCMLLPTDTYIERSKSYLLQPIRVPANRNCRDCMTELVIGRKSEFTRAPPFLFQPHLPSLLTLYTIGLSYSLFTLLFRDVLSIGRLMLVLNELHPEYEQVPSLPQGCDEMSPPVEEYTPYFSKILPH